MLIHTFDTKFYGSFGLHLCDVINVNVEVVLLIYQDCRINGFGY